MKLSKISLLIFTIFLLIPFESIAADVTLAWEPSSSQVDGYRIYYGTTEGVYPDSIDVGNVTQYTVTGLQDDIRYYFVTRAYNADGESDDSNYVSWINLTSDSDPPTVSITGPTSTTSAVVDLSGTAADNGSVSEISWTNDRGGSGMALGTSSWSISGISLTEGPNTITVSATDGFGNVGHDTLTITRIAPDTQNPTVNVSGPGTSTEAIINLSGTASDNTGVARVTWQNDRGGSGVASGTSNWTASGIVLSAGENIITVSAFDDADNSGQRVITITYSPPAGIFTSVFGNTDSADYPNTVEDTYINSGDTTGNFALDNDMIVVYTYPSNTNANAILLKWNIDSIPDNAVIQSAQLQLYSDGVISTGGDDLYDVTIHKIINRNPIIDLCTWSTYDGSNAWSGGSNGGESDIAAAEDNQMIDRTVGYKTWNVTDMVNEWITNPSSNFGMMLRSNTGTNTSSANTNRIFIPTEYSDSGKRPKLTITYAIPDPNDTTAPAAPTGIRLSAN